MVPYAVHSGLRILGKSQHPGDRFQVSMSAIVNIAGYKFVPLADLAERRQTLRTRCKELELRGTILLSPEGINLFLAGERDAVDTFLNFLRSEPLLAEFRVKESPGDRQPFNRLLVRLKKEIIAFGVPGIDPVRYTSRRLPPRELKRWLDEGRDVALLDVRNNYEIELGTFRNAVVADIDSFRDFPAAVQALREEHGQRPVVTFCTGGIRCEKAAPFLEQAGFEHVYQLEGGILQYFEDCGAEHYQGDCFVFDQRVAVDPELQETDAEICFACQHVLGPEDRRSPAYRVGESCPWCFCSREQAMARTIQSRQAAIQSATCPLPGSQAYDNLRPIRVPRRFDGMQLVDFLDGLNPHIGRNYWAQRVRQGNLLHNGRVLVSDDRVTAGQRIEHRLAATVEPPVSADITILFEDESIVVVNKPAPLPMHPSGRFNRNTLVWILAQVYEAPLRVAHRLDANTSGLVVFSKTARIAARLQPQFENRTVQKRYLARIHGHPQVDRWTIRHRLSTETGSWGQRRVSAGGRLCETRVEVICRQPGGTSLIHAFPVTGRTNQIRIHLWQDGHPVVGDPAWRPEGVVADAQTLGPAEPPMCLHAEALEFSHPGSGEPFVLETDLPVWARGPDSGPGN